MGGEDYRDGAIEELKGEADGAAVGKLQEWVQGEDDYEPDVLKCAKYREEFP